MAEPQDVGAYQAVADLYNARFLTLDTRRSSNGEMVEWRVRAA